MTTQPRLVNKQFNSPINLYSPQNIQEVLDRETQILANGAVGIDFRNPNVGKPANLKNSAVLRMLEEEENMQRNGYGPGSDRHSRMVQNRSWPPPEYEQKNKIQSAFKDTVTPGAKRVAWPPPNETGFDGPYTENNVAPTQGDAAPNSYQQQAQSQVYQPQHQPPVDVRSSGASSPVVHQAPKSWAPVHSPISAPSQPTWGAPTASSISSLSSSPQPQPVPQPTWGQAPARPEPAAAAPQPAWGQTQPSSQPQTFPQPAWRQNSATKSVPVPESNNDSLPLWRKPTSTHFEAAHQPVSQQTYLGQLYLPDSQKSQPSQQAQTPQKQPTRYHTPTQHSEVQKSQYQNQSQASQLQQNQYQSQSQTQNKYQQLASQQNQYQAESQQQAIQKQQQVTQQYQPQGVQQQQRQISQQQIVQQYQSPGHYQQQQTVQQQQFQTSRQYEVHTTKQYSSQAPGVVQSTQTVKEYSTTSQSTPQGTQTVTEYSTSSSQTPQTPGQVGSIAAGAPTQVTPRAPTKPVEPPPSTITLRPQAPFNQAPPPLVTSQPATATLKGGKHLRGDLKWPPENVKHQMEEEKRLRLELAQGPACRPPKKEKDYAEFFAQHQLNSTYPGYKIPPGTQFYRPV